MISRTTLFLFVLLASSMTTNVDAAAAAFTTGTGGKVNVNNTPASADVSTGSSGGSSSSPKTSTSSKTDLKAQATATPSASVSSSFSNLFGAKKSSGAASLQSSTLSSLNDLSLMLSRANEIATVAMDHAVPLFGDAYTSSFVNKDDKKEAQNSVQDEVDQYWLNPTFKYEGTTKVPCTNADRAVHALERLFPTYVKYSHAVVLAGNNSNNSSNHKIENTMNIPQPLVQSLARAAAKANQKDVKMDALANARQIIREELAESEASIDSVNIEILMDTLVPINNSKTDSNNSKFQWYTGYLPEVGDVCLQINTFRPSSQSREQFEKEAKLISSMANFVNAFVKFIPSTPTRSVSLSEDEKKMEVNGAKNDAKLTKFASPKSLNLLSLDENQAKIQNNNVASRSENDSSDRPIANLVKDFTDGILEELDAKVLDTTAQEALDLELELNSKSKVRSEVVAHLSTNNMIVSKIVSAKPNTEVNEEAAAYTFIADATMSMSRDAAMGMEKERSVENDMAMSMQQGGIISKRMKFPFQSLYFKKVFLAFLVLLSRVVSLGQLELCFDD